jgi:spore germination protein GerM
MSTTRQLRLDQLRGLATVPLALVLLVSCSDNSTVTSSGPSAAPSTTPPTATASPGTAPTAAPATTAPTAGTRAVAVYYVRDTTNGPRLYREFHRRPATTDALRDAVTAMLTEPAVDRDYTSLWPKTTRVKGVRLDGSTAIVDLSKEASSGGFGASFESASLQQLVWTATAANSSVKTVQLLVEGRKVETLWGHVDTSKPMTRGMAAAELGPVWILTPVEGGKIKRGSRFGGEASVFEATVS